MPPRTVEALASRDSAPQSQGRVRVTLMAISKVGHRDVTPHPSRGKKVAILIAMIANLMGGDDVLSSSPRHLKCISDCLHKVLCNKAAMP